MPPRARAVAFGLLTAAAVLAVDQITKHWAQGALTPGRRVTIPPGWLTFDLIVNTGAAFSTLSGHNALLIVISSALLAGILVLLFQSRPSVLIAVGLGAVLGGGASNLLDRFRLQAVVDFIRIPVWPADFNLADVAIRLGAAGVVAAVLVGWVRPSAGVTRRLRR